MRYLDALAASLAVGLASAGVWRAFAVDVVTRGLRERLFGDGEGGVRELGTLGKWLHTWWKCPWCAGAWVTAAVTIATDLTVDGGLPAPLLVFAAARYVTGWIGSRDSDYQEQMMRGEP